MLSCFEFLDKAEKFEEGVELLNQLYLATLDAKAYQEWLQYRLAQQTRKKRKEPVSS